jgi:MGT family glycosyltransferase
VVEDNVVGFPALPASGRPWARIVSCNPAELKDPDVPPTFSGYSGRDRSGWDEFCAEYDRTHRPLWNDFDAFMRESGAPGLPDLEFIHESPWLNLFLYPAEVDYARARPLGARWQRLDSCVRATDEDWPELADFAADGALVYLSLGSLGSADVDLMRRLVATLADSPHRFVVSKGPQHDEYELADNMRGAEFLPQTTILPHVDLVITHGGNNTVTESFHFGKPMIVLPLFWDQYDNAQRVDELGFGVRLDTYGHEPDDLRGAVERLLADDALRARMLPIAERLQASPGSIKAATLIEHVTPTSTRVRSARV